MAILKSFYRHFLAGKQQYRVLDLGCGDGILIDELLSIDASISATLVDGSADMLKKALFNYIFSHLDNGGYFVNIEVILPPTAALDGWYLNLWREWIIEKQTALNDAGFKDVDCYYKYGIFAIYGGRRPDTGYSKNGVMRNQKSSKTSNTEIV